MERRLGHRLPAATLLAGVLAAGAWATAGAATAPDAPAPATDFEVDPDAAVSIGLVLEPENLDILTTAGAALDQVLLDNVYETLLTATPDGEVRPGLATVVVSDDGLVYTLTIADGVRFHSGEPLTSADVVYSLELIRTEGVDAAALADIASVEALDEQTVEITLGRPNSDLAWNLSRRAGVVVRDGTTPDSIRASANGTGPFLLGDWNQGASITLTRNDAYRGDVPRVAEVVFNYFGDPNALVNALLDGDIQIATAVSSELVGRFEGDPGFEIHTAPSNGEFTLGMNNQDEALSNPLVRQAITQAIDRNGVLDLFNGYGTVIGAPVPPFDPWYEDLAELYPYDPDAARALLAQAGYGDGLDLRYLVWSGYPAAISDYVVAQLGDIGIDVDLQQIDFGVWREQVYSNHDYDLTAVLHVEPRDLYHYANPHYYWLYDNPDVQNLLERAIRTADVEEGIELRRQAMRIVAEDAPAVWLILYNDVIVATTDVAGYPTFDVNARFDASGIVVAR